MKRRALVALALALVALGAMRDVGRGAQTTPSLSFVFFPPAD